MGALEAAVMGAVWDAGDWVGVAEIHEALAEDRPLAYTTVMTILVRLWRKGRLERRRAGRVYLYRATQSREEYAATRMAELLASTANRRRALGFFVSSLSARDRAEIRRLVSRRRAD